MNKYLPYVILFIGLECKIFIGLECKFSIMSQKFKFH